MSLIKIRKIFFQEVNYLVLITALYYGTLRIHEADKNIIWHKLDTLALIAIFILPIPYMIYLLKCVYFLTKRENFTKIFKLIKQWVSKINTLSTQAFEKTTLLRKNPDYIFLIFFCILGFGCLIKIYISLILILTNIAKLLPH